MQPATPWNSLEVAKLAVSVATPLLIFIFGVWLQRSLKRLEQAQWANRQIVEKRLRVYDETAPLLNDLLCYFAYVGNWKELTPRQLVDAKRVLDKSIHLAAPLFTRQWLELYNKYIHECFATFNQMGSDAKLRTTPANRRQYSRVPWDGSWDSLFAEEERRADPQDVIRAYDNLMVCFAEELGLGVSRSTRLLVERAAADAETVRLAKRKRDV